MAATARMIPANSCQSLTAPYTLHIRIVYRGGWMGIVNIDDDLHEQIRKASTVSSRSINAQAAFWIKMGMLCELNPQLTFNEIVARELKRAGLDARSVKIAAR